MHDSKFNLIIFKGKYNFADNFLFRMQISLAEDSYEREYVIIRDIASFFSPIDGNVLTDTRRDVSSPGASGTRKCHRAKASRSGYFYGGKKKKKEKKGRRQKRDQRGAISPSFSFPEFSRHGRAIKANGSVLSVGSPGKRTPPCAQEAEGSNAVTEIRVASPRDEKQIAGQNGETRRRTLLRSPTRGRHNARADAQCASRVMDRYGY